MWPALIRGSVFSSIRGSALLPSDNNAADTHSNLSDINHTGISTLNANSKHDTSTDISSTGVYNLNNWMKNGTTTLNESTTSLPSTHRCEMLSIEELTTNNRSHPPWHTTEPSQLFPVPENHLGPSTPDHYSGIAKDDSSGGFKGRRTTSNRSFESSALRSSAIEASHLPSTIKKKTSKGPDDRPYGCGLCDRRFNRRYNLNAHIRTHDPLRTRLFDCPSCNQSFDRKHDRDRHMDALHYARKRRYICELCDASFSRRDALARHGHKQHTIPPSMYI